MREPSNIGRIILEPEARAALEQMLSDLKAREGCIRISPSKLASWIVGHYRLSSFEQDQEEIIRAHFNPREYLKRMLDGSVPESGLADALQTALTRIQPCGGDRPKPRGRPGKRAKPPQPSEVHPSPPGKEGEGQ